MDQAAKGARGSALLPPMNQKAASRGSASLLRVFDASRDSSSSSDFESALPDDRISDILIITYADDEEPEGLPPQPVPAALRSVLQLATGEMKEERSLKTDESGQATESDKSWSPRFRENFIGTRLRTVRVSSMEGVNTPWLGYQRYENRVAAGFKYAYDPKCDSNQLSKSLDEKDGLTKQRRSLFSSRLYGSRVKIVNETRNRSV